MSTDSNSNKKIVCIGGGAGSAAVLHALKSHPVQLTAIMSMTDDGQSQAVLRDEYHVLPPSDVRKALLALTPDDSPLKKVFKYRFQSGPLNDFTVGNIFLAGFEKVTGSIEAGIEYAAKILEAKGTVLPVTLDDARLFARLTDGTTIKGETNIDIGNVDRAPIKNVWLEPEARINPKVKTAIAEADMIIIGPGDLYTSLIPNFLVSGVKEAIAASRAKKVFIANLVTKVGETRGFKAEDLVREIEIYLGAPVDCVVFNSKEPSQAMLDQYVAEQSEFVAPPKASNKYILADVLSEDDGYLRHDNGEKLAMVLLAL